MPLLDVNDIFTSGGVMKNQKKIYELCIKLSSIFAGALILIFALTFGIRKIEFKKISEAPELSVEQTYELQNQMLAKYSAFYETLQNLPYELVPAELDVKAESAILIDTANGNILYEKNAEKVIPPASMTKLFAMYVVDEEVAAGNLSYDQIIPLPPESWACNMPPHSSLMFLGEGQIVTLEELLLGLSVCSGNDAAYALAYTVCGSMESFVERMNQVAFDLGLKNTHFVESSGYSEENTTTAKEMAEFCCVYLNQHPDSLEKFHSVSSFTYPKKENLAPGDMIENQDFSQGLPRHITMPITQKNTNPLLGKLDGCDGLKTGYIDESGYNLALTAKRNGMRFLSVTMKGPGKNVSEGQSGRIHDGTELMEWAFSSFSDYSLFVYNHPYFVKTYGSAKKAVNLVPAYSPECVTVPFMKGESLAENLTYVSVVENVPDYIFGSVVAGQSYGSIKILLGDYLLQEIPLIADRSLKKSNAFIQIIDKMLL